MAYADYIFYTETYKGNAISSADFERLAVRASSYLDQITFGRVSSCSAEDAVKMAACAVAEVWQQNEQGGQLQSQTVGKWSKTYAVSASTPESRLYAAAKLYLSDTGLLYRGC